MLFDERSTYDSITYGINHPSPLNDIHFFHVAAGQLPQDIMHTLLEGVLQKEIQLLLNQFVFVDNVFTLSTLNQRISSFSYGFSEVKDRPPKELEAKHLKKGVCGR